jgi:isopentenyl-diphosphate delta-isomerase
MTELIPAFLDGKLVPVEKLEVHRRGLRHLAISVFVMRGADLLLQRRAAGKYHTPGLWTNTCCTHPRWGEDPVACAVRRLREELGISGLQPRLRDKIEYRADVGQDLTEHELVDILLAEAPADLSVTPNPDEVEAVRWIGLPDLDRELQRWPERFTPWMRIYMAQHRAQIFDLWPAR